MFTNCDVNPFVLGCGKLLKSTCPPAGSAFPRRVVKWFELELILWGEGYITTEGISIPTHKGTVFFRTPGMVVQGFPPYSCYRIVFDMIYSKDRLEQYGETEYIQAESRHSFWLNEAYTADDHSCFKLPYSLECTSHEMLESIFEKCYMDFLKNRRSHTSLVQKSAVLEIFSFLSEQSFVGAANKTRSINTNLKNIKEVMAVIEHNPSENYTLEALAAMASLSPNFFCSIFKKIAGMSPFVYLNTARIRMACRLLLETNMPIKEISITCGFQNETYFYTTFKRFQGQPPQAYRKSVYWASLP